MSQEFHRPVDNVAGRDVNAQDKSIHNSNVINLNFSDVGATSTPSLSGETIVWQQQEEIKELIRFIVQHSGLEINEVYRKFSAHFDGKIYRDLPIERYREAEEWLKAWLAKEKSKSTQPPLASMPPKQPLKESKDSVLDRPCTECEKASKSAQAANAAKDKSEKAQAKLDQQNKQLNEELQKLRRINVDQEFHYKKELELTQEALSRVKSTARKPGKDYMKTLLVTLFAAVTSIAAAGYLFTKNAALAKDLAAAQAQNRTCQYDKKIYLPGGTVTKPGNVIMECIGRTLESSAQWIEVKPKVEKKITPRRKMTDDSFDQQDTY